MSRDAILSKFLTETKRFEDVLYEARNDNEQEVEFEVVLLIIHPHKDDPVVPDPRNYYFS